VFKDFPGRVALLVGLALVAGLLLAACGGGSSTLAQAEKEQAEQHGREEAQEKTKELRLEQKLQKLERENREAKKRHREKERRELKEGNEQDSAPPSTGSTPPPTTPSGTDCGGGTIAGPETSCGFAIETRAEYEREIGAGSGDVEAWSQANEQWYDMYCTEGSRHECSGAISATVYWP
jgi:type II secretory pathway pseudopilin PulG